MPLAASALIALSVALPAPSARFAELMASETSLDADDSRPVQERGAMLITDWM